MSAPGVGTPPTPRASRTPRISRGRALLAVAATAATTFALASLTWFRAPVTQAVGQTEVSVSGTGAAPVIGALLLVVAAGLVAFLLARGVLARIVSVVLLLAGLGVLVAIVAAVGDPAGPLRTAAATLTGVPELAGAVVVTPWGWVCAGSSVLLVLAGLALTTAPTPAPRPSRYERTAPAGGPPGERDAIEDWDALTRGDDPT